MYAKMTFRRKTPYESYLLAQVGVVFYQRKISSTKTDFYAF